jgi:peptide/nickel transport system substrate-binding protein
MRRGLLTGLGLASAALLAACQPSAPPAAPAKTEPPKPSGGAAPTAAPAAAAAAKPAAAKPADAKPADAAKPAAEAKPAEAKPAEAKPAQAAPAGGKPTASGKIVMAMSGEPIGLENWRTTLADVIPVNRNVEEALVNRNPKTAELVGELAESWSQPDPKTWRFKLRDGVKFHSGTVFDAEAAAFGVNWTFSKENNFPIRSNVGPPFEAKAVDRLTLDVVSETPDPILPSRLYFAPLPDPAQVKNDAASLPIKPIGTGPYKFVEWVKGQRIRLTVNPDWWGHGNAGAMGAATIQDVELVFRGETAVRASMLQSGEADFARFLTPDLKDSVPRAVQGPSLETVFLRLDTMYPPMADIRVRKAIALAIDKQGVADKIFGGAARPASQLVASVVTGYNPDLQPYPYDMDTAKKLVAEARADGVPVDMVITSATRRGVYARHDEFSEYTASQLNAIGLKAKSEVMDPGIHQPQFTNGGPDKVPKDRGWIANNPHSNEIMDVSRSMGYYRCDGSSSTYCDPEMDKLIDAAIPLTGEARAKALAAITKKFYDTYATVPVVHLDLIHGTSKRLQWESRIDGFLMLKEMSLSG